MSLRRSSNSFRTRSWWWTLITWRVLAANTRFNMLTAYTRNELSGMDVRALLPEWQAGAIHSPAFDERQPLSIQPAIQPLIRRNRTQLKVQFSLYRSVPSKKGT